MDKVVRSFLSLCRGKHIFCILRFLFQFKDFANLNFGFFLNLMLVAFDIKIFKPRKFFNSCYLENSWIPCTCSIIFKSKETIGHNLIQYTQESRSKFLGSICVFVFQLLSRNCHIQWIYEDLFIFYSINKFFKPRCGSSYYNELLETPGFFTFVSENTTFLFSTIVLHPFKKALSCAALTYDFNRVRCFFNS